MQAFICSFPNLLLFLVAFILLAMRAKVELNRRIENVVMYHRIPKRFAVTMLSASLIMVLLLVVVLATTNRPIPTKPDALTGRCITPDCVGTFLHETALNTSNVNVDQFGLLFRRKVDWWRER